MSAEQAQFGPPADPVKDPLKDLPLLHVLYRTCAGARAAPPHELPKVLLTRDWPHLLSAHATGCQTTANSPHGMPSLNLHQTRALLKLKRVSKAWCDAVRLLVGGIRLKLVLGLRAPVPGSGLGLPLTPSTVDALMRTIQTHPRIVWLDISVTSTASQTAGLIPTPVAGFQVAAAAAVRASAPFRELTSCLDGPENSSEHTSVHRYLACLLLCATWPEKRLQIDVQWPPWCGTHHRFYIVHARLRYDTHTNAARPHHAYIHLDTGPKWYTRDNDIYEHSGNLRPCPGDPPCACGLRLSHMNTQRSAAAMHLLGGLVELHPSVAGQALRHVPPVLCHPASERGSGESLALLFSLRCVRLETVFATLISKRFQPVDGPAREIGLSLSHIGFFGSAYIDVELLKALRSPTSRISALELIHCICLADAGIGARFLDAVSSLPYLVDLRLPDCGILNVHLTRLSRTLGRLPGLQHLDLSQATDAASASLQDYALLAGDAVPFFTALGGLGDLLTLNLAGLRAGTSTPAAVALVDALKRLVHLVWLDVSNMGLQDEDVCALAAEALPTMNGLQVLRLSNNNIGDRGAAAVRAVAQCALRALFELDLSNNASIGTAECGLLQQLPTTRARTAEAAHDDALAGHDALQVASAMDTLASRFVRSAGRLVQHLRRVLLQNDAIFRWSYMLCMFLSVPTWHFQYFIWSIFGSTLTAIYVELLWYWQMAMWAWAFLIWFEWLLSFRELQWGWS